VKVNNRWGRIKRRIQSASSRRLWACGFIAVTTALFLAPSETAFASTGDDGDIDVVLLGDSYSAGNYWVPDENQCHRSWDNWAER
jgi:hypothetical protein